MTPLYVYSLIPVLSISLLLFFSLLFYAGRSMLGLMSYCGAVAVWSGALLLFVFPATAELGERLVPIGGFIVASFAHAAYDLSKQRDYRLIWLAYVAATLITVFGYFLPGLMYSPGALRAGPAFWPSIGLALVAGLLPLSRMARAYAGASATEKRQFWILTLSGVIGSLGAWTNAVLLTNGIVVPYPMLLVLASVLLVTGLVPNLERSSGRRLVERSLIYAALTALLSACVLFGVMTFMTESAEPRLGRYRLGVLFVSFMAALAVEPVRQRVQRALSRKFLGHHAGSEELARALLQQEARADQATRLAELGRFVSAVAHEVRNPLGVIAANVKLLEREGTNPELCDAIKSELRRASTFVDDLLRYGRPRPLELRMVEVGATLRLARSTAESGAGVDTSGITWDGENISEHTLVEADQGQLLQALVVVVDNAILALQGSERKCCQLRVIKAEADVQIEVEDSGPGLPAEIAARVFEPFVTGRKREGSRSGTGLGLAIAKSIVERHHGEIAFAASTLGGARCIIRLPRAQPIVTMNSKAEQ